MKNYIDNFNELPLIDKVVTVLSAFVALDMFVFLMLVGFYLGKGVVDLLF